MKLRSIPWVAFVALALAGCATQPKAPGATFDRIGQEFQQAVAAKPKSVDEALDRAMMPPVQLDLPKAETPPESRFDLAVSNAPAS